MSWYSGGPIITLNGCITAIDYVDVLGNQVHATVQMLFPNNDAVLQDVLQHVPWPAQLPLK
jgi:hypothetical protein